LKSLLKLVGTEVLSTDDQDGFKAAAESILSSPLSPPEGLVVTPKQSLGDLALIEWVMLGHPDSASQLLADLYDRYAQAPAPRKGERATIWYSIRNHVLCLWNHWHRYTCYRTLLGQEIRTLNQTNNTTERVIGWSIKERYRTMHGYKPKASITNVASLTAWLREKPVGRDMSPRFAS
jgi:hypothetical protein